MTVRLRRPRGLAPIGSRDRALRVGKLGTSAEERCGGATTDRDRAKALIGETLARMNCRVHSVREGRSGRSFIYTVRMPASVADELVTKGLAATLAPEIGVVEVEIRED